MSDYDSYKFFAVFSKLESNMENEKEKAKLMQKFKTLLTDAVNETGMVNGAVITQRDKGIGQAGSNRTFCFDVYVSRENMRDPESFDGEAFSEAVESYINHMEHYSWMKVLNKDSDIVFGRASEIKDQL